MVSKCRPGGPTCGLRVPIPGHRIVERLELRAASGAQHCHAAGNRDTLGDEELLHPRDGRIVGADAGAVVLDEHLVDMQPAADRLPARAHPRRIPGHALHRLHRYVDGYLEGVERVRRSPAGLRRARDGSEDEERGRAQPLSA